MVLDEHIKHSELEVFEHRINYMKITSDERK